MGCVFHISHSHKEKGKKWTKGVPFQLFGFLPRMISTNFHLLMNRGITAAYTLSRYRLLNRIRISGENTMSTEWKYKDTYSNAAISSFTSSRNSFLLNKTTSGVQKIKSKSWIVMHRRNNFLLLPVTGSGGGLLVVDLFWGCITCCCWSWMGGCCDTTTGCVGSSSLTIETIELLMGTWPSSPPILISRLMMTYTFRWML